MEQSLELMKQLLSCGTDIPLWQYDTEGHLVDTNSEYLVLDKILAHIGGIRYMLRYSRKNKKPLVLGSDMGLTWCAVFAWEKEQLQGIWLLGPVLSGEVPASYMEESVGRYHIDSTFRSQYLQVLRRISVVPTVLLLQYALMLHYCVNGEKLARSDIQFQPRKDIISPMAEQEHPENDRLRFYSSQQALLRMVREGDMNYRQAIAESQNLFGAWPGSNREPLNRVTVRATGFTELCIREAIQAGISPDTAYAVGEGYVELMLQCRTAAELSSVTLAMFEDFVLRSHKHRTNPKVSAQIQSCRDYIELHADQALPLSLLANRVGYSEYYLSRKFRKEMGVSINTYIKYVRVERSKMMLTSTAVTVAQIANTLHFASSSHFSEAFREITGKTPQQYRLEHQKF